MLIHVHVTSVSSLLRQHISQNKYWKVYKTVPTFLIMFEPTAEQPKDLE